MKNSIRTNEEWKKVQSIYTFYRNPNWHFSLFLTQPENKPSSQYFPLYLFLWSICGNYNWSANMCYLSCKDLPALSGSLHCTLVCTLPVPRFLLLRSMTVNINSVSYFFNTQWRISACLSLPTFKGFLCKERTMVKRGKVSNWYCSSVKKCEIFLNKIRYSWTKIKLWEATPRCEPTEGQRWMLTAIIRCYSFLFTLSTSSLAVIKVLSSFFRKVSVACSRHKRGSCLTSHDYYTPLNSTSCLCALAVGGALNRKHSALVSNNG